MLRADSVRSFADRIPSTAPGHPERSRWWPRRRSEAERNSVSFGGLQKLIRSQKSGGPIQAARFPEAARKLGLALSQEPVDEKLVSGRRRAAEGKRNWAQAEFKQPVAPTRLQIVLPLRNSACDQLHLPVIQTKLFIKALALGLDRSFIGEKDALRTTFDDGRRN